MRFHYHTHDLFQYHYLAQKQNIEAVARSVVSLTKIIKANNPATKINYPELANDLYNFQLGFEAARKVAIKWGREYFWLNDEINSKESRED